MSNSLFSKEIQNQLKELKGQLAKGRDTNARAAQEEKPAESVSLPSQKQVKKTVQRLASEHVDDDKVLFMQAMSGVKPLSDKNIVSPVKKANQKPDAVTLAKRAAAQGEVQGEYSQQLSDMQALLNPVSGESYLSYKVASLQNKVFSQLKQGKIHWYDAVDLHGSSIEEARNAVLQLIHQAKNNGENCVKIVHGKGEESILKTCVNGWLRQLPDVLAFCSAPNTQGGNGAVLVLLKKNKP